MLVRLPDDARTALGRLALREFRGPSEQAAAIIVEYLRARALLDQIRAREIVAGSARRRKQPRCGKRKNGYRDG